jgi:hypothetical protein
MKLRNVSAWAVLVSALAAGSAYGADAKARIDISGVASKIAVIPETTGDGVTAAPGMGVTGDAAKQTLTYQMPVADAQWKTMTFSFTPQASGKVNLSLRGEYRKDGETWVYFDDLQVKKATIANGDFEEKDAKNLPANWQVKPGQHPLLVQDASIVKSGKACVKVSHSNRMAQDLTVEAGTEVSVSVQVRLSKVEAK